ncbi:MAG: ImmA/IrrE family metallo-endopeptidase [Deltaproteobacteria bacterium]|nr:ImmA/IrrE family metallo-endopeptidase [Deltaproteobacteria bacterium]MBW2075658.1 ImmA/IrrE family metallo-endopeptidase [Deltaproteobacteria bacterium]
MKPNKGVEEIFRTRAREARVAAGFSLAGAAKHLGFNNYQTLSAIEKGTRKINANELISMARLYGRSLDYFFEPEISPDPTPLWRKSTEISVKQIQRQFLSFLENYSNLENLLGLERRWKDIQRNYDKADFSARGFELADRLGAEIWDSLDLGSRPASNMLSVLENDLRIKVLHLPLPQENGISGACVVDETLGVGILINANDAPWRRNFDLAHELFHIVTWNVFTHEEVGDGTVRTKPEQYADAFASSLLLPKSHLLDALEEVAINKPIKLIDVIELAKDFGVSTEAILWRLVNLRVLEKSKVEKAVNDPRLREIDRVKRRGLYYKDRPPKFPERYISLAWRCLMEGKISRGTFSEYLGIDRAGIDRYLKEQGFMESNYEEIAFA